MLDNVYNSNTICLIYRITYDIVNVNSEKLSLASMMSSDQIVKCIILIVIFFSLLKNLLELVQPIIYN